MKVSTPPGLENLLAMDAQYQFADIYDFLLSDGVTHLRYTTADTNILYGGNVYTSKGPFFDQLSSSARGHWKVGLDVDTWVIQIAPAAADPITGAAFPSTILGQPWLAAVRGGALDGATVTISRVYWPISRQNYIRNSALIGAVVGTPGTLPTPGGWGFTRASIDDLSSRNNIETMTFSLNQVVGGGGEIDINLGENPNGVVKASVGQKWTGSTYFQVLVDDPDVTSWNLEVLAMNGVVEVNRSVNNITANRLLFQRYSTTVTCGINTTNVFHRLRLVIGAGLTLTAQIKIGRTQLEPGTLMTDAQPTTGTPMTLPWQTPLIPAYALLNYFRGRVAAIDLGRTGAVITINSQLEQFGRPMPRNLWGPSCRHTLFDSGCTLSKAAFAEPVTVTSVVGNNFFFSNTIAQSARYNLGFITWLTGNNVGFSRAVRQGPGDSGSFLLIALMPFNVQAGDTFWAYPGCDKTSVTCATKFNNLANFGGEPFIPAPESAL